MEKANEAWENQTANSNYNQFAVLRFAHMCSTSLWLVITQLTCQNEMKVFTERTWNASPASILKNKRKAKHHILPFSGSAHLIAVHSSVFRYHSSSFYFNPVSFRLFGHIPVHSVPFLCLVLLWLILALHWCHFTSLRCHSGSFRYIPVPFLSIPFHSGVILRRSGIFRFIPVYSVPFRSCV